VFRGAENLGVQAQALKFRSALSKVRSALRAHSERIQSGYRAGNSACERRGEIQALPRTGSALLKVQSAFQADTERIQSDG
jgi:hypothetical protein